MDFTHWFRPEIFFEIHRFYPRIFPVDFPTDLFRTHGFSSRPMDFTHGFFCDTQILPADFPHGFQPRMFFRTHGFYSWVLHMDFLETHGFYQWIFARILPTDFANLLFSGPADFPMDFTHGSYTHVFLGPRIFHWFTDSLFRNIDFPTDFS